MDGLTSKYYSYCFFMVIQCIQQEHHSLWDKNINLVTRELFDHKELSSKCDSQCQASSE